MWSRKVFLSLFCIVGVSLHATVAGAVAPVNPRSVDVATTGRGGNGDVVLRRATNNVRSRSSVVPRSTVNTGRTAKNSAATRSDVKVDVTRSATVSRAGRTSNVPVNARTGKVLGSVLGGWARSATTARATAIFSDVSKIGSGYAACRESYSTCMDQLCANANDTYRRCFCSDRFMNFRNTEDALDRAMIMLQQFQDRNLDAVDKTTAEVNAMYSATVGEAAIKKDTSESAKTLQKITDLLSGKSSSTKSTSNTNSLGVLSFDFNTDMDDIWSGDGTSSIFSSMGQDISSLEGAALFSAAQKQCLRLTQNNCENDAVFSMARSSYNILVTQDCNAYEKSLNKKRETVAQAVRMAEKYLREARLEEYRAHNSDDVNACIASVRAAILADTACGENYKRCLDPTGAYIDAKGEPIYTPRLLKLEDTIQLDGTSTDILGQNQNFNKFLDGYRKYVTRELDRCRDISEFVWTEFKRGAVIEIAQAQTDKIEEVKASCVDTISECYDSKSSTLVNMGKSTATTAAALGRYAARDMCRENVIACANLFNTSSKMCSFDTRGHLEGGSTAEYSCGLASLLNYVDAVDTISVVEKCAAAVDEYLVNLCTPDDGKHSYPYNCKGMNPNNVSGDNMSLPAAIKRFADNNCSDIGGSFSGSSYAKNADGTGGVQGEIDVRIKVITDNVKNAVRAELGDICESLGGMWYSNDNPSILSYTGGYEFLPKDKQSPTNEYGYIPFYNEVSGRGVIDSDLRLWGACIESDARTKCKDYETDGWATWDASTETCVFTDEWYEDRCENFLDGVWDGVYCYVPSNQ